MSKDKEVKGIENLLKKLLSEDEFELLSTIIKNKGSIGQEDYDVQDRV